MKYQIVIKIPFEAIDDLEARNKARKIVDNLHVSDNVDVKFQKLLENQPPKGMPFD
jgi:hypothetical protein